ncbi:MAG TPA: hypothetical protein DCZ91_08470 [Lachnospiraceae bacterium]|nr:hypothetical protein [Lachnospiraceae bacterium]
MYREKGQSIMIHLYTGNGKGKTTAAIGLIMSQKWSAYVTLMKKE